MHGIVRASQTRLSGIKIGRPVPLLCFRTIPLRPSASFSTLASCWHIASTSFSSTAVRRVLAYPFTSDSGETHRVKQPCRRAPKLVTNIDLPTHSLVFDGSSHNSIVFIPNGGGSFKFRRSGVKQSVLGAQFMLSKVGAFGCFTELTGSFVR